MDFFLDLDLDSGTGSSLSSSENLEVIDGRSTALAFSWLMLISTVGLSSLVSLGADSLNLSKRLALLSFAYFA